MSATNSTANYSLPIFVSSDVPSWLTDWNGAMGDIDTAIAAAKAVADSALLASGNNTSDITTIQGQITTLQTTVGTHTTQIGTISGNINTINSLIGNGTPTTTDQTIIGAINELHANQGDLADLTTTDKSSLVAAINEAAQGGGGSPAASAVSYDNSGSGLSATDVQDAIDEVSDIITRSEAGTFVDISSYNTGANKYTFPSDGYVYQSTGGTLTVSQMFGSNDVKIGELVCESGNATMVFVRKSSKIFLSTNTGADNVFKFIPLE